MQSPLTIKERALRWHHLPMESRMRQLIQNQLDLLLPSVYGYCLVGLGHFADDFTYEKASVVNVVRLNGEFNNDALVDCRQLPLANDDVDAVFLPFQLQLCAEPHALLRECYRSLRPGGKLILVNLNPVSVLGVRRLFQHFDKNPLWKCPFYRVGRLIDWLELLGFSVSVEHRLLNPWTLSRFHKIRNYSDSFGYSALGIVNVLVAEKRVVPLTMDKPWKRLKKIHPSGIETVGRSMHIEPLESRNRDPML